MSEITCPRCQHQLGSQNNFCPHCGEDLTNSEMNLYPADVAPELFASFDPVCCSCGTTVDRTANPCPKCGRQDAGPEAAFLVDKRYSENFFHEPQPPVRSNRRMTLFWVGLGAFAVSALSFFDLASWHILPVSAFLYRLLFWGGILVGVCAWVFRKSQPIGSCPACGNHLYYDIYTDIFERKAADPWTPEYIASRWCEKCGQPFYHADLYQGYFGKLKSAQTEADRVARVEQGRRERREARRAKQE